MEPDEYLKTMRTRPPGRAQWGGFPEGVVVAYMLKVEVGFFCEKSIFEVIKSLANVRPREASDHCRSRVSFVEANALRFADDDRRAVGI